MFASYMKRLFNPILPSPYKDSNGDVVVELISDALEQFDGDMSVRVYKFDSMSPLFGLDIPITGVCTYIIM